MINAGTNNRYVILRNPKRLSNKMMTALYAMTEASGINRTIGSCCPGHHGHGIRVIKQLAIRLSTGLNILT